MVAATSRQLIVKRNFFKDEKSGEYDFEEGQIWIEYLQSGRFYLQNHCNKDGFGFNLRRFEEKYMADGKYADWFDDKFQELPPMPTNKTEYWHIVKNRFESELNELEELVKEKTEMINYIKSVLTQA